MNSRIQWAIGLAATLVLGQLAWAQKGGAGIVNINVSRSVRAITYKPGASTRIAFQGTPLSPYATGDASVQSKPGATLVDARFSRLELPSRFGAGYLTYVLWSISPEGRVANLGELVVGGGKASLKVSTRLQAFGLFVTAEPYFAVQYPSQAVVVENMPRPDTAGAVEMVDAKADLLRQRGDYTEAGLTFSPYDAKTPPELYQARNALKVALWQKTDKYAGDSFAKAKAAYDQAEAYAANRKQSRKVVAMAARTAIQLLEDARIISLKRQDEERQEMERQAAAAQAKAEAEAKAAEEARRQAELAAAREAQMRAERAAAEAKLKAEAAIKEAAAQAEAERQRQAARQAREAAEKAEQDKQALRARLLDQLNRILDTRDTSRGLVVNMADVLFDTGKYNLRPEAREKLAKMSGIILAYPGLVLAVEGHTDSTGSDAFNEKLSEQRADTVRQYLVDQGLAADSISSEGFGKAMPIADNATAEGRQQNRRVEIIVSGEVIGTRIGR